MPASPIRKLAHLSEEAKRRGVKVFHLNIGQPDLPSPTEAFDALSQIQPGVLSYTPSAGIYSLRSRLSGYYRSFGLDVDPEDIIVTCGGSEAVLFAFMACLNPGDEIIVPEPAYANYMAFAVSAGAKIVPLTSHIEDNFALPPVEEIERLITPRTKGVLICNPNNPTGYLYSREELERIRDIVEQHDLYLFSDEVYREFCYTSVPYVSALQLEGIDDKVVLIDSVSKRYSECGIRIGALLTRNSALREVVMKFCQARLSPPLLGQIVAEASMDASQSYMQAVHEEYRHRRDCLVAGLNSIPGVFSPLPTGAFYTVAKLPVDNAEKFCRWCLSDFSYEGMTVFLAPAEGFYTTPGLGRDEVRIAYVLNIDELTTALKVLEKALEVYPGRVV